MGSVGGGGGVLEAGAYVDAGDVVFPIAKALSVLEDLIGGGSEGHRQLQRVPHQHA